MIVFMNGDIFDSKAEGLLNPVNCEGVMGKGLAYQFKIKFPKTNIDYVKTCKENKLIVRKLHFYKENDKVIINFPTKDKWRSKSKITYIDEGMQELIRIIPIIQLKSIAIPPLGCGNGGLDWHQVKPIIVKYSELVSQNVDFYIYEPSERL